MAAEALNGLILAAQRRHRAKTWQAHDGARTLDEPYQPLYVLHSTYLLTAACMHYYCPREGKSRYSRRSRHIEMDFGATGGDVFDMEPTWESYHAAARITPTRVASASHPNTPYVCFLPPVVLPHLLHTCPYWTKNSQGRAANCVRWTVQFKTLSQKVSRQ